MMKMKYSGIDCHAVKNGGTYEGEYINDKTVKVEGKGFIYTFKYNCYEDMEKQWDQQ